MVQNQASYALSCKAQSCLKDYSPTVRKLLLVFPKLQEISVYKTKTER